MLVFRTSLNSRYEKSVPAFLPGPKARLGHNEIGERVSRGWGVRIEDKNDGRGMGGGQTALFAGTFVYTRICVHVRAWKRR